MIGLIKQKGWKPISKYPDGNPKEIVAPNKSIWEKSMWSGKYQDSGDKYQQVASGPSNAAEYQTQSAKQRASRGT